MSVASRSSSRFSRHRSLPILVMIAVIAAALAPVTMLEIARGVGLGAEPSGDQRGRHRRRIGIGRAHRALQPDDVRSAARGPRGHLRDVDRRDDHATRGMGAGSAERSSRRPRPHRERVGHLCLDRRCHVRVGDGRNRRQRRDSHPRRHHRGRRRRLGHDDEHLAGGGGRRSLPRPARASSACPAERSGPAPTPTTTPPTSPSASSPGRRTSPRRRRRTRLRDPAARSVGDARRTPDHARSDADRDADPDGDPRAASGDPDRGGSRRARRDGGDDRGRHAHRLRFPRRGWLRRRRDRRDRRPPRRWDRSGPASGSASPARSTIGSPSARFAPMPARS